MHVHPNTESPSHSHTHTDKMTLLKIQPGAKSTIPNQLMGTPLRNYGYQSIYNINEINEKEGDPVTMTDEGIL